MNNIKNALSKAKSKVICGGLIAANTLMTSMGAHATGIQDVTIKMDETSDPFQGMENIIGLILAIFRYVGIAVIVYGVYELVMGITQDGQMEKKTKGIIFIGAGFILAALKTVLGWLGVLQ